MDNKKGAIICSSFFLFCMILNYFLLVNYFENNSFMTFEIFENFKVQDMFLIPSITYSVFFIVWIIVRKEIAGNFENLIYEWPKKGLEKIIDSNSRKSIVGFFLLSTAITGSIWYMVGISTSEVLLAIIPFTEFIPDIKGECESIAVLLKDFYENIEYIILLTGPIWALILKRNRDYEIKYSISKHRGTRVLVLFFWAIVILFVIDNAHDIGCKIDREPGLYAIPPGPSYYLISGIIFATLYGGLITVFIFVLNKYFQKLFNFSKN